MQISTDSEPEEIFYAERLSRWHFKCRELLLIVLMRNGPRISAEPWRFRFKILMGLPRERPYYYVVSTMRAFLTLHFPVISQHRSLQARNLHLDICLVRLREM